MDCRANSIYRLRWRRARRGLEDTNDIGFAAVVVGPSKPAPPGVYFRMLLGGITGHGVFARDCGVLLLPEEVLPAAVAVLRCFIGYGDRTDRTRARLHYLIEGWGLNDFLPRRLLTCPSSGDLLPSRYASPGGRSTSAAT